MSTTGKEKSLVFKNEATVKNIEPFLFNYSKLLQIVNKIPVRSSLSRHQLRYVYDTFLCYILLHQCYCVTLRYYLLL